jgi:nucleotide-binding universal stress UspA family protein
MKILVPVDGSVLALGALHHALQMARDGQRLHLVLAHVQAGNASLYALVSGRSAEAAPDPAAEAGLKMLEDGAALCQGLRVSHECVVEQGEPAPTLAQLAQSYQCDAIVMGARGQGGHRSTALGSVAHALLYRSMLPVTLVRTPPLSSRDDPSEMTIDRTMPIIRR